MSSPAQESKRKRRWYRFSLRTLLLLLTLFVAVLGVWARYVEPFRVQRSAMAGIQDAGGSVQTAPGGPAWMRDLVGERWFLDVIHVDVSESRQPDEYLAHLARLPFLETLIVAGDGFTDEHAKTLHRKNTLRWLILDSTSVSQSELIALRSALPNTTVYRSYRKDLAWLRPEETPLQFGTAMLMNQTTHIETRQNRPDAFVNELDDAFFEEPVVLSDVPLVIRVETSHRPSYLTRIVRFQSLERLSVGPTFFEKWNATVAGRPIKSSFPAHSRCLPKGPA